MGEWLAAAGISAGTLAAIGASSAAIGTAVSVYSAASSAQHQAALARAAAEASDLQAKSQLDTAAYNERQFRRRADLIVGQQQAIFGAAGVDTASGSPLLQELDTVRQTEMEALNIRRGGDVAAAASRFEARLRRFQGDYFSGQIPGQIAGGVLQGGGSILGNWLRPSGGTRRQAAVDYGGS